MAGRRIQLMDLGYRYAHMINLILISTLIVTGLMLFLPDLTSWLAYAIGQPLSTLLGLKTDPVTAGVQFARMLHRVAGFTWGAFLIVYTVYYILFNRRFEIVKSVLRSITVQYREAVALLKHYALGRPIPDSVKSGMGRYNVMVGWLFLLTLVPGALLVAVSGVALVYREQLGLTLADARLMYMLHDIGFILILLFLLLHLYASLHPSNRPLLRAVFGDGRVSEEFVREHMGAVDASKLQEA